MRFSPSFIDLPASVPGHFYNFTALSEAQKKKWNRKLKYVRPTEDQKNLVRKIASYVDPKIWVDPIVMKGLSVGALALSQLTEVGAPGHAHLGSGYVCLPTADGYVLFDVRGKELFSGNVAELFHFVCGVCPRAQGAATAAVAMGYVKPRFNAEQIQDLLAHYRRARSYSTALDKSSKIAQYKRIDQDSTIVKFTVAEDLRQHNKALHIGSGDSVSSSVKALSGYERVVTVDPRLYPGPDSIADVFDPKKVQPGWDIFSDVAYGDDDGMVLGESRELAKALYGMCADRLVVAKLPLVRGYGGVRGTLLRKPRPHNLEAIFIIEKDGKRLDHYCDKWEEKIKDANEKRNRWVHVQQLPDELKSTYHNKAELRNLMLVVTNKIPDVEHSRHITKISRNAVLARQSGGEKANQRYVQFSRKCLQSDYKFKARGFALLPPSVDLRGKTFREIDPPIPDPDLAIRSIYHSAVGRGLSVVFNKEWCVN